MNLASIIEGHPEDDVALIGGNRVTTYGQLRALSAAVRGGLSERGVRSGDRVALILGNERDFAVSYLAVIGLGAIAVPINPASPAPEVARHLALVEASAVIIGPAATEMWRSFDRPLVPTLQLVFATDAAADVDAIGFAALEAAQPLRAVEVHPSAVAALLLTGGTTGTPKAAMLTHGSLRANIDQNLAVPDGLRASDVVYGVLPLFHIFGLNVVLGLSLAVGASVLLVQRFDPSTALDSIASRRVTAIFGVPTMWVAWSQFAEAHPDAFAGVRLATSGAAKLPEDRARAFERTFGLPIREGYGLTEAGPVVTSSVGVEPRVGSVGVPIPGVQIRLVDEWGEDVLEGDAGEIWVKGPNVFAGYWEDPEATALALTPDGWLRTGDVAVVDGGYLSLVDRVKDLIIVSGFNVYPVEVEDVLGTAPGVADVAVVGVPHPFTGEAVKAYVVPSPGATLDEEQLIEFCAARLARYKCPTKILFVDALPRGLGGKLLRRQLR